jgi:hypothetical protein
MGFALTFKCSLVKTVEITNTQKASLRNTIATSQDQQDVGKYQRPYWNGNIGDAKFTAADRKLTEVEAVS